MDIVEYLKLRRQVEQAHPGLIEQAERLKAEVVKDKALISLDQMWDRLIELAGGGEYQFKIIKEKDEGT